MARLFNGTVLTALVAGFVGGMLAPVVWSNGSRPGRPAAKSAIKAGLALYQFGRERVAELGETAGDLIAEVQAEREAEASARHAAGQGGGAGGAAALAPEADAEAAGRRRYDA